MMRCSLPRRFQLILLALLPLLLTGCGQGAAPAATQPAAGSADNPAAALQELRFVSAADHHFMDPQRMSWMHDIRIAECLFEPLLRVRLPELTLEGGVASSWEASSDGLTYTFHLRPEARWSNGEPVQAEDFRFAWRRAMSPDCAADYTQLFFCIRGARDYFQFRQQQISDYAKAAHSPAAAQALWDQAGEFFGKNVGISAPDERTLIVQLAQPTPYFAQLCAFTTFMPNHAASVARHAQINVDSGMCGIDPDYFSKPEHLVSNGAYILELKRFKRDLVLKPNPHYWNRAVLGNSGIHEFINDNHQAALIGYAQGEYDWLPDIPTASSLAADLVNQGRPDVHVSPAAGTYFYNFNCRPTRPDGSSNPLADPRVRRALSLAIDRATIVGKVTRLKQPVARTFVPAGALTQYHPPADAGSVFNLAQAKALLAEAGYPEGKGLTGIGILYNTGAGHENIAQVIARTWQEGLGLSVQLEGVESRVFGERLKNGDYVVARASWFGDYRDPTTFLDKFRAGNGNNDAAWTNPQFDALMTQADGELDEAKRMQLMEQAEAMMLQEQPIAPIFQYVKLHVFDATKVSDVHPNIWDFRRLELVRVHR